MSTRRRQPRRDDLDARQGFLPPVRNLELRRRQLSEAEAEAEAFEFLEEYDASGHHLRLERFPR
jgi:hypothetical protein